MDKKHSTITPVTILDINTDTNFTFERMGLWGNRSENMTQQQILERFPFREVSVCWTFGPNPILENLSPIEAIWDGRLDEVLHLARQTFPTLYEE